VANKAGIIAIIPYIAVIVSPLSKFCLPC
jgi:hypothetical protein